MTNIWICPKFLGSPSSCIWPSELKKEWKKEKRETLTKHKKRFSTSPPTPRKKKQKSYILYIWYFYLLHLTFIFTINNITSTNSLKVILFFDFLSYTHNMYIKYIFGLPAPLSLWILNVFNKRVFCWSRNLYGIVFFFYTCSDWRFSLRPRRAGKVLLRYAVTFHYFLFLIFSRSRRSIRLNRVRFTLPSMAV